MRLKLTLELDFALFGEHAAELTAVEAAVRIGRELENYSDGRYPFSVEMVRRGIEEIVSGEVRQVFSDRAYARHGNRMIAGKVVAAHLAGKRTEDLHAHLWGAEGPAIKVARVELFKEDSDR